MLNFRVATHANPVVGRLLMPPAAAVASGVLLGLALPPRGVALLAWIAVIPLLYYIRRVAAPAGLALGMIAGLCAAAVGFGIPRGAQALAALAPFYGSAVLLLALIAGGGAALRNLEAMWWAAAIAVLAVTAELSTFPLAPLHLALCLWRIPALLQLAAITGIWGVSFMLWWFNAGLAVSRSKDMRPLTGPAILAVLSILLGSRFIGPPPTKTQATLLTAIQTSRFEQSSLVRLGRPPRRQGSRLLTFPMHTGSADAAARGSAARELARTLHGYLVLGCMQTAGSERYHAAAILSPRGRLRGLSSQIHLACRDRAHFHPGLCAGSAKLPLGYIGMPINCDTCYTDACRNLALQSVDIFCCPTDDPPAPRSSLNILHAAFYPFRSIENGVPCVRADTRAFSLITDHFGRIVALSKKQEMRAVVGSVDSEARQTPYRRLGDSFAWSCAALTLLLLCGSAGRGYRDYRSNASAS